MSIYHHSSHISSFVNLKSYSNIIKLRETAAKSQNVQQNEMNSHLYTIVGLQYSGIHYQLDSERSLTGGGVRMAK